MKRRVNTAFLVMCLSLAVQLAVGVFSSVFQVLNQLGVSLPSYYTEFVLLQFLSPIATCILALVALRMIRIDPQSVVTANPLKRDFFPWLGFFLGATVVMNYAVNGLLWGLEQVGIVIPDTFASYDPQNLPQAICYFVVLVLLPPVCEEVLCRATVTGLLKHFHPWTAVLVSAYAFGMMHGTVQQIPFAFALGIILGLVYVKTGNLLYPILLHFANNLWACVMTFVSVWGSEMWINLLGYGADLVFLAAGSLSFIWLLKNKQFTLTEIPYSLTSAEAKTAVTRSPWFWVFTGVYGGLTLASLGLDFLQELLSLQ